MKKNLFTKDASKILLSVFLIFAFIFSNSALLPLGKVEAIPDDGGWVDTSSCLATDCGTSEGTKTQALYEEVCEYSCPIVTFEWTTKEYGDCPAGYSVRYGHPDECKKDSNPDKGKIIDRPYEIINNSVDVVYEKSADPTKCHRPSDSDLRDDYGLYGDVRNEFKEDNPQWLDANENCTIELADTRTVDCSDAEIIPCDPVCGNGILENGEECDDGNTDDGDGCLSICQSEQINGGGLLATIIAHKIVCEDESYLPNWGTSESDGNPIAENTAQSFLDEVNAGKDEDVCWFGVDWDFEWGYNNEVSKEEGDYIGYAGGSWHQFDSETGLDGKSAITIISDLQGTSNFWVREVLKEGYIPFSYYSGSGVGSDVSAEIYCHEDVYKYDNYDRVDSPQLGETYYCVAFNAPVEELEQTGTLTVMKEFVGVEQGVPESFSFSINNGDPQPFESDGTNVVFVPVGEYFVTETDPGSEWTVGYSEGCDSIMEEDDQVECTITNTYDPSQVCEDVIVVSDTTNSVYDTEKTLLGDAKATWVHQNWTSINTATWIWKTYYVEDSTQDETYIFSKTFDVVGTVSSATLELAADNTYKVWINDVFVGENLGEHNYEATVSYDVTNKIQSGNNTIKFEVMNMGLADSTAESNPAGLLYKLDISRSSCEPELVPGCMDTEALNYNSEATIDDQSCEYPPEDVYGCTDPDALNYNSEATIDDDSCTFPEKPILGCMDSGATNYNSEATEDDGSCTYSTYRRRGGTVVPQGEVLGEATTTEACGLYLFQHIKYGADNDPAEVMKLQIFLNEFMGDNLTVNGIYDQETLNAVNQFQLACKEEVLRPWVLAGYLENENTPTGYVYLTTKRWINLLKCPSLNIPMPNLFPDLTGSSLGLGENNEEVLGEETVLEEETTTTVEEEPEEVSAPVEETVLEETGIPTTTEKEGINWLTIIFWIIALAVILSLAVWAYKKK